MPLNLEGILSGEDLLFGVMKECLSLFYAAISGGVKPCWCLRLMRHCQLLFEGSPLVLLYIKVYVYMRQIILAQVHITCCL